MKSVMNHNFSRVPTTQIERSVFDRSHGVKTAFDSGYLIPIVVDEILPGDEFKVNATLFGRLAPTVAPIMDNVFIDTQWFFVPSRLIWTNFVKMMGERVNPKDSIDFSVPMLNSGSTGFAVGSLADYMGIPPLVPNLDVSALPFRAMAKIYDDWYRDENLQDSVIQSSSDLGDSNGTINWNRLYKRGKRHDYFTSCLPWPSKGEGVELPLGTTAPVRWNDGAEAPFYVSSTAHPVSNNGTPLTTQEAVSVNSLSAHTGGLVADLSMATAATINSLRTAFQIQRLLEADARGGTRYFELLLSHFKTVNPDARLQRSEYLAGSSQPIVFNQVENNTPTSSTAPQGSLVSNGKFSFSVKFDKSFTEHGYLIGLCSVRCDMNYQSSLNRLWSRRTRYDFYWPTLAHLGEQAVLNKEIYAQGANVKDENGNIIDDLPFGYQERYAEYRYHPSMITGKMRSQAPQSLDVWHLAQKFTSLPKLNSDFIEENPPLARCLSVTNEPQIILDGFIGCIATRPLCTYAIPGLVDHF